jgi:hypothetical protein
MSLSFPKRGFAGAPVAGTLNTNIALTDTGTTFGSSTPLTGWTDITGGTFSGAYLCVTFGYGTSTEEKILCTYNTSTLTFTISDRGYDGTSAQTWPTGSLFILTWTATEAAELNAATQSLKTILQNTGTVTTPQTILVGTGVGAVGSGTKPAAIDHDHKITPSALNGWLSGSAAGQMSSSVTVYPTSLVAGALPAIVTTSNVFNLTGTTVSSAITGYNNYIILVTFYGKATTASTYPKILLNRSASALMTSPTTMLTVQEYYPDNANTYTMSGFVLYQPGSSSTFYLQLASQLANAPTLSGIVIGIN